MKLKLANLFLVLSIIFIMPKEITAASQGICCAFSKKQLQFPTLDNPRSLVLVVSDNNNKSKVRGLNLQKSVERVCSHFGGTSQKINQHKQGGLTGTKFVNTNCNYHTKKLRYCRYAHLKGHVEGTNKDYVCFTDERAYTAGGKSFKHESEKPQKDYPGLKMPA